MTRERDDRGFTLVELLVAITLMSFAFLAVFGGLGLFFKIESIQRANATIDVELRAYADRILATPYVACPATYSGVTKPTGFTTTVTVEYWNGTVPADSNFTSTCPSTDRALQRITITLTDSKGNSGTLKFAKLDEKK